MRAVFFLLTLFVTQAVAGVQTFDPGFFDDGDAMGTYGEPHVDTFSDDFFESDRGKLSKTRPGGYGCTSVRVITASQASGAIGRKVQNYCAGRPDIKQIPSLDRNRRTHSFLICCFKKPKY